MSNKNSRFKHTQPTVWRHMELTLDGNDRNNYLACLDSVAARGGQVVNITRRIRKGGIVLATGQASEADKHEFVLIIRVPESKMGYFLPKQAPPPAAEVAENLIKDLDDAPPDGAVIPPGEGNGQAGPDV